jgi:hypothetical protein
MAFVNDDRVLSTTKTVGTGAATLELTAPTGFQTFSAAMAVNDYCHYCIVGGSEWEVGLGELTGSTTFTRRQVYSSSNADALVSFAAGTKSIYITQPGHRKGTPVVFIFVSTGQVTNTTTETSVLGSGIGTRTFPGYSLFFGRTIRIQACGVLSTALVPGTLRIKIKLGSTVILDTGAQTPAASIVDLIWKIDAVITVRAVGSVTTVIGQSVFEHQAVVLAAMVSWGMTNTAAINVDLTASQELDITATWGTASTSNDIRCTNCTVESLN